MLKQDDTRRPGDLFIERYMPGASAAEREAAHENLRRLISVLIRINERLVREEAEQIRINAGGAVESES